MKNLTLLINTSLIAFLSQIFSDQKRILDNKAGHFYSLFITVLFSMTMGINPLHAQAIQQVNTSGNQAGVASTLATVAIPGKIITAIRTNDTGGLKLISWSIPRTGNIQRLGDSGNQAGAMNIFLAMTRIGNNKVATLIDYGNGNKKIILWLVENNGHITRLTDSGNQLGTSTGSYMDIYYMDTMGKIVTAMRDSRGNVKLASWRISGTGQLIRLKEFVHKKGYSPKLIKLNQSSFGDALVLAYRNQNNNLALTTFRLASGGGFTLIHESAYGRTLSNLGISAYKDQLVIGLKVEDTGGFKLITWAMNSAGRLIRKGEGTAGMMYSVSMQVTKKLRGGGFVVSAALKLAHNKMKIINWKIENGGASVTRIGSSPEIGNSIIQVDLVHITGPMTTAIISINQRLQLRNWSY